jgi:hypothetical protein
MQKLRIANTYNKETKQYEKESFELRESEKSLTGKVNISSKKNDKYISKTMPFVAFKSKIDIDTENAIRNSRGQLFNAEIGLIPDSFTADDGKEVIYIKVVINKASFEQINQHSIDKGNGYQPQEDLPDDSIPF